MPASSSAASGKGTPLTGYDVAIIGGRVIDPETHFDKVANVGIKGSTIAAIADHPIQAKKVIDAHGLVVSPGFIDNLSYEPNEFGVWYKIADGITTTLGMHGIDGQASTFFRSGQGGKWPVHFGGAFDDPWWREHIGLGITASPSASQISALAREAEQQIADGFIGVDLEPEYDPGTSFDEEVAIAKVAALHNMPAYFHARYADDQAPGTEADAVDEVIRVAQASGAAVHIEHINSTGGTYTMAARLTQMQQARDRGIDITACEYPYNFWSTFLASARFSPGWQQRFHITYSDLEMPGTGERLTESSFKRYQAQNKVIVAYAIPEESVRVALASPLVMMGSDTILVSGAGRHPRGAGMAAHLLGHYVRELHVLSLTDALAKLTIAPAKRVEKGAPQMLKKGRLQVGMDADITIFNPTTIIDNATVRHPDRYSTGIQWVLVMGHTVKSPAGIDKTARFGDPILSPAALAAGKYGMHASATSTPQRTTARNAT